MLASINGMQIPGWPQWPGVVLLNKWSWNGKLILKKKWMDQPLLNQRLMGDSMIWFEI